MKHGSKDDVSDFQALKSELMTKPFVASITDGKTANEYHVELISGDTAVIREGEPYTKKHNLWYTVTRKGSLATAIKDAFIWGSHGSCECVPNREEHDCEKCELAWLPDSCTIYGDAPVWLCGNPDNLSHLTAREILNCLETAFRQK